MKKLSFAAFAAAVLIGAASAALPAFAASNPADDISAYSYAAGKTSYEARMAEDHAWYNNEDASVTQNYRFRIGSRAASARSEAFAELPSDRALTDEELAEFFAGKGIGEGSSCSDGAYNEAAKNGYGYAAGREAAQARQASFGTNQ